MRSHIIDSILRFIRSKISIVKIGIHIDRIRGFYCYGVVSEIKEGQTVRVIKNPMESPVIFPGNEDIPELSNHPFFVISKIKYVDYDEELALIRLKRC